MLVVTHRWVTGVLACWSIVPFQNLHKTKSIKVKKQNTPKWNLKYSVHLLTQNLDPSIKPVHLPAPHKVHTVCASWLFHRPAGHWRHSEAPRKSTNLSCRSGELMSWWYYFSWQRIHQIHQLILLRSSKYTWNHLEGSKIYHIIQENTMCTCGQTQERSSWHIWQPKSPSNIAILAGIRWSGTSSVTRRSNLP